MTQFVKIRECLRPSMLRPSIDVVRQRIRSHEQAIVLRRDLEAPHTRPKAAIDITVRPLTEADVPKILHAGREVPADDVLYRSRRRWLLESGLGTCYAAVTAEDEPCYVQWLMGEQDNARIQSYFGGAFPVLEPGTALLEGAFTPPQFRGKGIMGLAMSLIAEKATDLGARYVITVVGTDNYPSLKGCEKANFFPYLYREVTWSMLRRRVTFEPVDQAAARQP
jgi:GNAT superfamily N-acetyltransferase